MNSDHRRVPTRFAPETRFELQPVSSGTSRVTLDLELDRFKSRLLKEHLARANDPALGPALRRAANEAAALVWLTAYPLLLLPILLEEKAVQARAQAVRQEAIRRRSRGLLLEAG
jgi:hypothetical protein